MKKTCETCDGCRQVRTLNSYPTFDCDKGRMIILNDMRFPSTEKGCEKWEEIQTNKWPYSEKKKVAY